MSRSILVEIAAILVASVVLGTAAHVFRTDAKQKIPFVTTYLDPLKVVPPKEPTRSPEVSVKAGEMIERVKPEGSPPTLEKPVPPPAGGPPGSKVEREKDPAVRDITAEEAIEEHKKGDTPFLDARRTARYEQGHIPRAKPFSVWEADIDQRISALLGEVPPEIPVIIYCSGGDCVDSHMLADKLKTAGYTDLRIFVAGFPEWQKRGLPVEKSEGAPDAPPGGEEDSK
jgi:rhodanese-related sulfurtransferase